MGLAMVCSGQQTCKSDERHIEIQNLNGCSDLLRVLAVIIIVVVIVLLVLLLLILLLLGIICLLFLFLLNLAQGLPLCGEGVSLCLVIADDDVVEDGAALALPKVKADEAEVSIAVDLVIMLVLGVVDLFDLPEALVCWV